jgi:predicted transcriptional regulator
MPADFRSALEAHAELRAKINGRRETLATRAAELFSAYTQTQEEHRQLGFKLESLAEVERMLREECGLSADSPNTAEPIDQQPVDDQNPRHDEFEAPKRVKARVGPQRYFILCSLREHGALTHERILEGTGLSARRVKEQIASDVELGFVEEEADGFRLTPQGHDLLSRFEASRRARGVPLPTQADILREEAGEEDGLGETDDRDVGVRDDRALETLRV